MEATSAVTEDNESTNHVNETPSFPNELNEEVVDCQPTLLTTEIISEPNISITQPDKEVEKTESVVNLPLVKRGRGRPKKSEVQHRKPTRGSQRVRKCTQVMTYDNIPKSKCVWKDAEKIQLLKGLERYGPENINALRLFLPFKTEKDIRNQIRMWKDFAHVELQKKIVLEKPKNKGSQSNCIKRLDNWIQHFEDIAEEPRPNHFALSNVFMLISEYGKFPTPAECNGVDFRAMYRYIHCMLNGQPYYGVNQATALMLNQSISDMFAMIREQSQVADLQPTLYNSAVFKTRQPCSKTYSRTPNRAVKRLSVTPESVLSSKDINPLNIPPHTLTKPEYRHESFDPDETFMRGN